MFWLGHVETYRVALAVGAAAPALWLGRDASPWVRGALFCALAALALWASAEWGAATGLVDDGRIVVDEVVGAAFALFCLRPRRPSAGAALLVGFIVVDRVKPWPLGRSEDLPGALGVVGDDIAAAVLVVVAVLIARALAGARR